MDNRFPDIKLFMTYSPNRHDRIFSHPLFYPVLAGSIFQKESTSKSFFKDNTGDNISQKNPYYCELTGYGKMLMPITMAFAIIVGFFLLRIPTLRKATQVLLCVAP